MKKVSTWYKNIRLSARVIISMNMAILISIVLISIFAAVNRANVQKNDARALVSNELEQVTTLLDFLQDRPLSDLESIISRRVLYNTGFISVISEDGQVLICRERQGQNVSSAGFFTRMAQSRRGEVVYTDAVTGGTNFQYHTFFDPLNLFITATLEKKEFIDKPVLNTLRILLIALIFTLITFSAANFFIMKTITTPIHGLVKVVRELGKGDLADTFHYPYKDEVGQMAQSVNELVEGLKQTAIFASEIGKNNFDHPFEPLSEKDVLGNSLLEMRQSLKAANEEEKIRKVEDEKRSWTTQGLAKFADILRQNNDNMKELSYDIIVNLVDYLEINQGGVFILNDDNPDTEKFLELTACFAYDRRKYLEKKIMLGEGLVGTCFLEKEPIYLTKIPSDYIRITSGLGDETPGSLLLVPLKLNDRVFGVIELASFKPFEKHKLEFVEKISESIASTISSVKINTQTAMLLEKSQQQAEEMRAQEEEMRQNMEELSATQESMAEKERDNLQAIENLTKENERNLSKVKSREEEMLATLDDCHEAVVRSDSNKKIVFFSKAAEKLWGYKKNEVQDKDIKMLLANGSEYEKFVSIADGAAKTKVLEKGKEIRILLQSGKEATALLNLIFTQSDEEGFFTGFFKGIEKDDATVEKVPVEPSAPAEKSDSDMETADSSEDNSSQAPEVTQSKRSARKPKDTGQTDAGQDSEIAKKLNLLDGDETDNQKAWSEHISQKGKTFKKSRKKQ